MTDTDRLVAYLHPSQHATFKAAGIIEMDGDQEVIRCALNGTINVRVVKPIPCKST